MEPDTLSKRIYHRILAQAPAGVWSRADFLDLGTANAVEKTLQRLANAGQIRRPHRGLYDITTHSNLTGGLVFPTRSAFIDAIARRDKLRVVIDGLTAANDLGLTTAVPARSTIYADTYPRTMEIHANHGDLADAKPVIYTLDFKRTAAKTAFWAGRPGMRIVQALDWYGKDILADAEEIVNGIVNAACRTPDPTSIAEDLSNNLNAAPAWMHPVLSGIAHAIAQRAPTVVEQDVGGDDNEPGQGMTP
jgi:hypothetical protein